MDDRRVEDLLRASGPPVLAALVRRHHDLGICEDAVQEALLAAAQQWPTDGTPDAPEAWLHRVASRRVVDRVRSDAARRRREERVAADPSRPDAAIDRTAAAPGASTPVGDGPLDPNDDAVDLANLDDTLQLLLLCCHPALTTPSQIALTLRAVGGLTTREIAAAFLVPEATMAQRISRAKQQIDDAGARFLAPTAAELPSRIRSVLHVVYLVFNEGYAASSGASLQRHDLAADAIRLARLLHRLRPDDGEVEGLLALLLLTDARREARATSDGSIVALDDQDRTTWNRTQIDEGVALVSHALTTRRLGPYQLQAAIAAVHAEAPSADATDWPQVLALYDLLVQVSPGPVVDLNRSVALAEVHGPDAGLAELERLEHDARLARNHRLHAVRGHLLEDVALPEDALASYRTAVRLATSAPEVRYLEGRITRLLADGTRPPRPS